MLPGASALQRGHSGGRERCAPVPCRPWATDDPRILGLRSCGPGRCERGGHSCFARYPGGRVGGGTTTGRVGGGTTVGGRGVGGGATVAGGRTVGGIEVGA